MSKVANRLKGMKKATEKVRHGTMRTNIPAGMAAAGPPLGPMLGQVLSPPTKNPHNLHLIYL